jgi:hypothetical protein
MSISWCRAVPLTMYKTPPSSYKKKSCFELFTYFLLSKNYPFIRDKQEEEKKKKKKKKKKIEHVNSDIVLNWKLETKSLCEIKLLALIIGSYCFNNTLTITITLYWINFVFA